MTDVFSKEKRSRIMSKIRSRDTKMEMEFAKRHPKAIPHPDYLPFHPDFAMKIMVIFLDSTFWHCNVPKTKFVNLAEKWKDKLENNLIRDLSATAFYRECFPECLVLRLGNELALEMLK